MLVSVKNNCQNYSKWRTFSNRVGKRNDLMVRITRLRVIFVTCYHNPQQLKAIKWTTADWWRYIMNNVINIIICDLISGTQVWLKSFKREGKSFLSLIRYTYTYKSESSIESVIWHSQRYKLTMQVIWIDLKVTITDHLFRWLLIFWLPLLCDWHAMKISISWM